MQLAEDYSLSARMQFVGKQSQLVLLYLVSEIYSLKPFSVVVDVV
jgi:hypothetical protein